MQPVYVRATSNNAAYPLLQKVLVSFGDQIGYDDTVKGALDQVFGGNSGTTSTPSGPSTSTSTTTKNPTALSKALSAAAQAMKDYQAANAKGDFAAAGRALDKLQTALAAAEAAQGSK
ncbi:unannotated protein [freshwater metagenome]|uniref:Unannotated protein n=1 Tax=freshwater metagenome TaxID=449393 RepID=A0A6J6HFZ1_9ZZZZ